jgi:hypothetical protein
MTQKRPQNPPKISEVSPQSPKIIHLSWFGNGHHHDQKSAARNGSGDHNNGSPVVTDHQDNMILEGNPKITPVVPKSIHDGTKPPR